MPRIRYQVAMSLDGCIAGPKGEADWITMDPAIDFKALFAQFDVFLKDRLTGGTRRASVMPGGAQLANGGNGGDLSPDGRWLSFSSLDALGAGDTNGVVDVFVADLRPDAPQLFCSALVNSQGCTPSIQEEATASARSRRRASTSRLATWGGFSFSVRVARSASATSAPTLLGSVGSIVATGSGMSAVYRKARRARRPPYASGFASQVRISERGTPLSLKRPRRISRLTFDA